MSIIYDALKKVEEAKRITYPKEIIKEDKSKYKIYLIYGLIVCFGVFIASIFLGRFSKPLETNIHQVAKDLPQIEKTLAEPIPKPIVPISTPLSVESKEESLISFVLNGIFFSEDEGYALINNQIAKVGDVIEGARVLRISLDEVELESKGSTIKLSTHK